MDTLHLLLAAALVYGMCLPSIQSQAVGPTPVSIDIAGCGSSKGCYRTPSDCTGSSCDWFVSWKSVSGGVEMEISGTVDASQQFVAVALSKDAGMGDDSVIDCINAGGGSIIIENSYNPGKSNEKLTDGSAGLVASSLAGSFNNGRLTCRLTRTVGSAAGGKVFDLNNEYSILMSKGAYASGQKGYHSGSRQIYPKVRPTDTSYGNVDTSGGGGDARRNAVLVAVHGCMMVIAWMVSASVAVLMPRYFKDAWPEKKWGGKAIWYQLHFPLMVCTLILTVLGFIIIFVEAGGYAEYPVWDGHQYAHPIIGIITTVLCITNPIMAAFRCDPGHKRRVVFNWAHFIVGELAHILAIVSIFLGLLMVKANVPRWAFTMMFGFVVFHVIIEIALAVHKHCCANKKIEDSKDNMDMDKQEDSQQNAGNGNRSASIVKTALVITHFIGVLIFALILLVTIGLAANP